MELVMEEYGQAFLALVSMTMGIMLAMYLIINEGIINEIVFAYMEGVSG